MAKWRWNSASDLLRETPCGSPSSCLDLRDSLTSVVHMYSLTTTDLALALFFRFVHDGHPELQIVNRTTAVLLYIATHPGPSEVRKRFR